MENLITEPAPVVIAQKLTKEQSDWITQNAFLGPVMVAEYRGEAMEVIKFTNKKTGSREQFTKHGLSLEFGADGGTHQMQADIDYAKDVEPVITSYVKGQKIIIVLSGMVKTRDAITANVARHRLF